MNFTIGKHFEEYVRNRVDAGKFNDAGEVIRAGLRLLEERDQALEAQLEALRQDIQAGVADLDNNRLGKRTVADIIRDVDGETA
ncbi:MAG: hypothetical protein A3G18_04535 [Rhodospirillales bacterium RIFCSPLOWO2_12_FULL_58_28]|nr:MAG: hypothetical protein A3H92_09325 [Rhodospirillales bacterium RIFCSPLOWO2_02_FULL_58_16]OHC76912.1 MAG: hypothetical protein A3G18_04535 [Rhodospirillales bacterium RIFCSPLOWO2_12_FULL_58_28]